MLRRKSTCFEPRQRYVDTVRLLALVVLTVFVNVWASHASADKLAGGVLAQKGSAGIPACLACHGTNGEGQAAPGHPRLGGQHQAYLVKQLQAFASGQRKNPQMDPIAGAMSAQQISDVAEYYASLPGWKPSANPVASSPQAVLGYKLATSGNWSKGMPACFACHGEGGAGVAPHFPSLAGQMSNYTRAQLKAWQAGTRDNDPQGLMKSVAIKMSDEEIAAVSLYLENPALNGKVK